jgi:hypothetical protein
LRQRSIAADVDIALGKGDLNAGLSQLIEYGKIERASHLSARGFPHVDPEQQFKID